MWPKILFCLFLLISGLFAVAAGPQVDPFYTHMLKTGEEAYRVRDCIKAVRYLEVAIFGLHPQKNLAAEGYVYLGLSHVYLKDFARGKDAFAQAAALLAPQGIETLELDETIRGDLERASDSIGIRLAPRQSVGGPVSPKDEARAAGGAESTSDMERRLRIDPHDVRIYYRLFSIYDKNGDPRACERILSGLVLNNPKESHGFFLLGRLEFGRKKYKQALGHFNRGLGPSDGGALDRDSRLRARIFVTFCLFRLDRLKETAANFKSLRDEYPEEDISAALKEEGLETSWSLMTRRLSGGR